MFVYVAKTNSLEVLREGVKIKKKKRKEEN